MNEFVLSKRAEADIDEIWTYIARNDRQAADQQIDRIYDRLEMLVQQPDFGESVGYLTAGLRRTRVGNYVIYYEIEANEILIRRVLRAARDVTKFFGGEGES